MMAVLKKLLIVSIFVCLVLGEVRADAAIEDDAAAAAAATAEVEIHDSRLKHESENLKSKISSLESIIKDKVLELESKDGSIAAMKEAHREMSEKIASLQDDIESLMKKKSMDAQEQVGKAHAQAGQLEQQVKKLKNELELERKKMTDLENRAIIVESQVQELNLKLESLQKTNDDQKRLLQSAKRALRAAEEDLLKAQKEAKLKADKLGEVHGAWLPPWLAAHLDLCQVFVVTHWNQHGKPVLDVIVQKASEKSAQVQKWAEPHVATVYSKWIPAAKEQWVVLTTHVEPYIQTASAKTVEIYETSKSTLKPHIIKAQELVEPYLKEAKKFSKPYIDQAATFSKPHVDKVQVALKPYTKKVARSYRRFLKTATMYHHQVQAALQEELKKHELTKSLATKELVWFLASALLALPALILYKMTSSLFCKKAKKPARTVQTNQPHRRPKRRHADK
ncbi:hypothetical protein QJS10_CPB18g00072 [Acorus calamus]|uniref:Uncharacterized protein n=1 Tax=Acorus calamus TaxID=4465 RepID=A0AAV9CM99_ACOCL|nr:hypothetical protein QJS10_CPB18g00072 [Acorus calamus]